MQDTYCEERVRIKTVERINDGGHDTVVVTPLHVVQHITLPHFLAGRLIFKLKVLLT